VNTDRHAPVAFGYQKKRVTSSFAFDQTEKVGVALLSFVVFM